MPASAFDNRTQIEPWFDDDLSTQAMFDDFLVAAAPDATVTAAQEIPAFVQEASGQMVGLVYC